MQKQILKQKVDKDRKRVQKQQYEIQQILQKYNEEVDRESAYEMLNEKIKQNESP